MIEGATALGSFSGGEPTSIDFGDGRGILRLRRYAMFGAGTITALGVVVLAGWGLGIPWLTSFDPKHASTSAATAICFILGGVAIYLQAKPGGAPSPGRLGFVLAALMLAVAGYDLSTYVHGAATAGYLFGPHMGKMAPSTAAGFALLSCSVLVGDVGRGYVRSGLAAAGLMLASIDVVCYVYGANALRTLLPFAAMALSTACLFIVLFASTLLARPDHGWLKYFVASNRGAAAARMLLPAIIVTPFLLSWSMVVADRLETFDTAFGFAVVAVVATFVLGTILCLAAAWLSRSDAALRLSNQSLVESEHLAREIVDTALDAFVQMDETGFVTDWNPQAEAIFGWSRAEAIGSPLMDLIIPLSAREAHAAGFRRFLQTGNSRILGRRLELDALQKDGTTIRVELTITALARRGGYVFNGFVRDLTEKLATEAKLRQSQKMEAIGNLTGGIAHDFNNLLAVIVGNLDELQLLSKGDTEATPLVDMALSAALRGADLTQRLLAFARRQPLQSKRIDPGKLLREHAKFLSRTLGEAIRIELDLPGNTWPIVADPAQLEAAILNLATNARDAMPKGGRIRIATSNCHGDDICALRVADLPPGDYVVVEVSDDGVGMTPEIRGRVFEPFFTTKERGKGTGLGLSMVFGFVKQSNGHISVSSEPGAGTTFRLYFPRARVADEEAVAVNLRPVGLGRGETILVVEDNADLRRLVVRQIESLGYRVTQAENAPAALAVARGGAIDLLFSDIVMSGGGNGIELARQVLAQSPQTRVVLTTGFVDGAVWERFGTLARSVRILKKPYRKGQLAEVLRAALDDQPQTEAEEKVAN
ncbi:MAG: PAS domain S-box protein [Alphaproteobacteria bacterium]|nr:PAS domain S-box protein [Alphaproteobacteria bacterium]